MKKIVFFKIYALLQILNTFFCAHAATREEVLKKAHHILELNEKSSDYDNKKMVFEKYLEMKESIRADFVSGNQLAPIDVYLLIDGLVEDNLQSLQTLLAASDRNSLEKDLAPALSYEDAQKLAFALKQNKTSFQTEFIIKNNTPSKKCVYRFNGYELKNRTSFYNPSEIPLYVGSYCDDNTFEIKKIQSESMQRKYVIQFSNDRKILFEKQNQENFNIPNPGRAHEDDENDGHGKTVSPNVTEEMQTDWDDEAGAGIQYSRFFGTLTNENVSNFGSNYGVLALSHWYVRHQYLVAALDAAPLNRDYVTLYQSLDQSIPPTKTVEAQHGFLIRPSIGLGNTFYGKSKKIGLTAKALLGATILKTNGNDPLSETGFGFEGMFGPSLLLWKNHFKVDVLAHIGQDFGPLQGYYLGTTMTLGYLF